MSPVYLLRSPNTIKVAPSRIARYGIALIVPVTTLFLKEELRELIGKETPFLLAFTSVLISAWYGGLGPGLLATLISSLGINYYFLEPGSYYPTSLPHIIQLGIFIAEGAIISLLNELRIQTNSALGQNTVLHENLIQAQSDLGEGVLVIEGNTVIYANDAVERLGGYPKEELATTENILKMIVPEQRSIIQDRLQKRLQGEQVEDNYEATIHHKSGQRVYVEVAVRMLKIGPVTRLIVLMRDITERKAVEAALRRSEEHYRLLVENVQDYAIFTLKKNGVIASWNEGAERILGYEESEVIGQHYDIFFQSDDKGENIPQRHLEEAEILGQIHTEGWRVKKNGDLFYSLGTVTPLWNEKGLLRGFVKVMHDITERKRTEDLARHQALHDALTDLPNRTLYCDRLDQAISIARRRGEQLAVMFLDLDQFKHINDSLGHSVGDQLLQQVANRLREAIRREDTVARLGGDEFTILVPQVKGPEDAVRVSKKIFKALRPEFEIGGQALHINTSIGIALYPQDGEDVQTLLKSADAALYQAKNMGRNLSQFYTPSLNNRAEQRLNLENSLRSGLDRGEFVLYYQPIIEVKSGTITRVEALVRWQHPELGLVLPGEFIGLAEETGLILPLNEWILKAACKQSTKWQKQGLPPLQLSINLSARQFSQENLIARIQSIVQETKAEPAMLDLEVTESFAMQNIEMTIEKLRQLKELGFHISIDDFGIGHSSLNYLRQLPANSIKIDRSFIMDCLHSHKDMEIVKAIISIAHSFDLTTIAEGVETSDQLNFLALLGCDYVQGFLFSQPVPAEKINELLRQQD